MEREAETLGEVGRVMGGRTAKTAVNPQTCDSPFSCSPPKADPLKAQREARTCLCPTTGNYPFPFGGVRDGEKLEEQVAYLSLAAENQ